VHTDPTIRTELVPYLLNRAEELNREGGADSPRFRALLQLFPSDRLWSLIDPLREVESQHRFAVDVGGAVAEVLYLRGEFTY